MKPSIKKLLFALLLPLTLTAGCGRNVPAPVPSQTPTSAPTAAPARSKAETAVYMLECMINGAYTDVHALFAPAPLEQIDGMGGVEAFLQTLYTQTGALISVNDEPLMLADQSGLTSYSVAVSTTTGAYVAQISVNDALLIEGFGLLPGAEDPIAMPDGATETAVTVDAKSGYPLEGRFVLPASQHGAVPAILLVQGSGATDYDEIVGVNRVFGKLARGLAKKGIATLRYSKRTYTYPAIALEQGYSIEQEYVEDVLAAVKQLKAMPGVDPNQVYILGHSLGGMLAPLFVERGADVAGIILLAGTSRNLFDVLVDQQEDLLAYLESMQLTDAVADYKKNQEAWRAERAALDTWGEQEARMQTGTVYGFPAYYAYTLQQVNGISLIQSNEIPTLVLQGGRDMQIYADKDFILYEQAFHDKAYVQMKLYENLSHIFTPSEATHLQQSQLEYMAPLEIPEEVFIDIGAWVHEGPRRYRTK